MTPLNADRIALAEIELRRACALADAFTYFAMDEPEHLPEFLKRAPEAVVHGMAALTERALALLKEAEGRKNVC